MPISTCARGGSRRAVRQAKAHAVCATNVRAGAPSAARRFRAPRVDGRSTKQRPQESDLHGRSYNPGRGRRGGAGPGTPTGSSCGLSCLGLGEVYLIFPRGRSSREGGPHFQKFALFLGPYSVLAPRFRRRASSCLRLRHQHTTAMPPKSTCCAHPCPTRADQLLRHVSARQIRSVVGRGWKE